MYEQSCIKRAVAARGVGNMTEHSSFFPDLLVRAMLIRLETITQKPTLTNLSSTSLERFYRQYSFVRKAASI